MVGVQELKTWERPEAAVGKINPGWISHPGGGKGSGRGRSWASRRSPGIGARRGRGREREGLASGVRMSVRVAPRRGSLRLLTRRLVVVDVDSLQLQRRLPHVAPGRVDAVLVADHFPELGRALKAGQNPTEPGAPQMRPAPQCPPRPAGANSKARLCPGCRGSPNRRGGILGAPGVAGSWGAARGLAGTPGPPWCRSGFHTGPPGCARSPSWRGRLCAATRALATAAGTGGRRGPPTSPDPRGPPRPSAHRPMAAGRALRAGRTRADRAPPSPSRPPSLGPRHAPLRSAPRPSSYLAPSTTLPTTHPARSPQLWRPSSSPAHAQQLR